MRQTTEQWPPSHWTITEYLVIRLGYSDFRNPLKQFWWTSDYVKYPCFFLSNFHVFWIKVGVLEVKNSVATKLRRSSFFEDFWPKIHLRLRPISKSRRIFEASKILGWRFQRFFRKICFCWRNFGWEMEENR